MNPTRPIVPEPPTDPELASVIAAWSPRFGPRPDVAMEPRAVPLAFVAAIYGGETLGRPVPQDSPPLFTCIAQDDVLLYRVVEGLYADWTDAGRSAELHIYRRGAHGFGMVKQGFPSDRWIEQFHDWLVDLKGERTGFPTTLASWTVGVTHRFSELFSVRPEFRYEYAFSARPWDNGLRTRQAMFAVDAVVRF